MADLTPKQQRFVAEYLVDLNATQAATRAGYSPKTAEQQGYQLLKKTSVAAAIAKAQAKRSAKLEIQADFVLSRWAEIADADPNELIQYRRGPCEKCWTGANARVADPNPACRDCHGEGIGAVFVHDTRKLTGAARRLYAGMRVGKDGIQVLMRNQDEALANIARHLGMFKNSVELGGPRGEPIMIVTGVRRAND